VTAAPIVIGLQSFTPPASADSRWLSSLLDEELRSCHARYPNSPLELLTREGEPLRALVAAVAAARRVTLRESAALNLADQCHVLMRVAPPRQRAADTDAVHLEPRYQVEFIDVLPDPAGGQPPGTLARHWSVGTDFALTASEKAGERALRRTDDFNRDVAHLRETPLPEPAPLARPGSLLDARCAPLQELFLATDALSTAYQRKVEQAFETIFMLASAAVVIYGFFSVFAATRETRFEEWLLAPYLLLLVLAYLVYYHARRSRIHDRFVEYRALAEGLRVQFYWCAFGINRAVANDYLLRHPLQLYWIRLALRSLFEEVGGAGGPSTPATEELLRYWITRERTYYTRTVARAHLNQRRTALLVTCLFVLGGLATVLVLLQSKLPFVVPWLRHLGWFTFVCPSIAAACVALANKLGVAYRAKHHARMLELYTQAERYFDAGNPLDLLGVARALGEATLHESGEWTLFRREQRIEEPVSPFRRPQ
jgi:hypothetical protein